MRTATIVTLLGAGAAVGAAAADCPAYIDYSKERHAPYSSGKYNLPFQRPSEECRTFKSQIVEDTITKYKDIIKDPDLYRLFENTFPNTLDTAIKWHGVAQDNGDEELTFLITGDINAMWLRDSANQLQSYLPLLDGSDSAPELASLFRGAINLQARYITQFPYCNSFQPPPESGIPAEGPSGATVKPKPDGKTVFECKYELDSLAAFLQISTDYVQSTKDTAFFGKFQWATAVKAILDVADAMMFPTYAANGSVNASPYTFVNTASTGTEVLNLNGIGNPFRGDCGLVRSFFRPSDDDTIFQGLIPANMQFSRYLNTSASIASAIGQGDLASRMSSLSGKVRAGIEQCGIVDHAEFGRVYAYEVDGFGGRNMMDDANIPSLLAAPFIGYVPVNDTVYQATRKMILSGDGNPYFSRGPVLTAIGGPHEGLGMPWPMASIMRIFTSSNDTEITEQLQQIVSSTDGLGLIHESVNSFDQSKWTRQWFSWANGLFGQCLLDLAARKPQILAQSFQ